MVARSRELVLDAVDLVRRAKTHVDDVGAVLDGELDRSRDVERGRDAVGPHRANRHDPGLGGHLEDQPRDERPVAERARILAHLYLVRRQPSVDQIEADQRAVGRRREVAGQIRMRQIDAGVDDCNDSPGATANPRHLVQMQGVVEVLRVVARSIERRVADLVKRERLCRMPTALGRRTRYVQVAARRADIGVGAHRLDDRWRAGRRRQPEKIRAIDLVGDRRAVLGCNRVDRDPSRGNDDGLAGHEFLVGATGKRGCRPQTRHDEPEDRGNGKCSSHDNPQSYHGNGL